MLPDDCEAYFEAKLEFVRVTGGTKAEIEEYWEWTKRETSSAQVRMVVRDEHGELKTIKQRSAGSESLRRRVMERLSKRKWDDQDATLIEEMAELLGMEVDGT